MDNIKEHNKPVQTEAYDAREHDEPAAKPSEPIPDVQAWTWDGPMSAPAAPRATARSARSVLSSMLPRLTGGGGRDTT